MSVDKSVLQSRPAGKALGLGALAAAGVAVLAWASCCVLPLALAAAGLSAGTLSLLAGQRSWITLAAIALFMTAGWVAWRQSRRCRTDPACPRPSRWTIGMLVVAGMLLLIALVWQPVLEAPLLHALLPLRVGR